VEAANSPGLGASFANGAQLSYRYVAPLAAPCVLPDLSRWLLARDSPLRFRPAADARQWLWCLQFLRACSRTQVRRTTGQLLALAHLSRGLLHELLDEHPIDFGLRQTGKLVVYSKAKSLARGKAQCEMQKHLGCRQQILDKAGCLTLEPSLCSGSRPILGGIYTEGEETGDCYRFCVGLARTLREARYQVTIVYGAAVRALIHDGRQIVGADTSAGIIEGGAYVVASGASSVDTMRSVGIHLPIYPLRGYSISAQLRPGVAGPRMSITDYDRRIVYAPIDGHIRVAGMMDLLSRRARIDGQRISQLVAEARRFFPGLSDYDVIQPWAGQRPATPTGYPILGRTPISNLFTNLGQGALGFTLALGSARIVVDAIMDQITTARTARPRRPVLRSPQYRAPSIEVREKLSS
jgi:D-amino-acid dehydrogenase